MILMKIRSVFPEYESNFENLSCKVEESFKKSYIETQMWMTSKSSSLSTD